MIVITPNRKFGIYSSVEVQETGLLCDGAFLPFNVIGRDFQLSNDDSLMPIDNNSGGTASNALSTEWLIDIGTFFDRFGAAKLAVLSSPDATVKAILSDVYARKWIDLKRADVAQSLAYIGTKVPSVTPELISSVLTTPVTEAENFALRKLYFS